MGRITLRRVARRRVQFDTTINQWHTCPQSGRINASNPCSGVHVPRQHGVQPRVAEPAEVLRRAPAPSTSTASAIRLWTIVLEISVLMAGLSVVRDRRALEVPHARTGLRQPRRTAHAGGHPLRQRRPAGPFATITAILTGRSYARNAEMAKIPGPSTATSQPRGDASRHPQTIAVRATCHTSLAGDGPRAPGDRNHGVEGSTSLPVSIDHTLFGAGARSDKERATPRRIANARDCSTRRWRHGTTLRVPAKHGYRNARSR